MTERSVLQAYVAHCPSCGAKLTFEWVENESARGTCSCKKAWFFIFDTDASGTFGVMSFQCDNSDRVMPIHIPASKMFEHVRTERIRRALIEETNGGD